MAAVSRSLGADKLIIMSDFDGIESTDGKLQRQLTVDAARQVLEIAGQGQKEALMLACDACDSGVPRSHLISYSLDPLENVPKQVLSQIVLPKSQSSNHFLF